MQREGCTKEGKYEELSPPRHASMNAEMIAQGLNNLRAWDEKQILADRKDEESDGRTKSVPRESEPSEDTKRKSKSPSRNKIVKMQGSASGSAAAAASTAEAPQGSSLPGCRLSAPSNAKTNWDAARGTSSHEEREELAQKRARDNEPKTAEKATNCRECPEERMLTGEDADVNVKKWKTEHEGLSNDAEGIRRIVAKDAANMSIANMMRRKT